MVLYLCVPHINKPVMMQEKRIGAINTGHFRGCLQVSLASRVMINGMKNVGTITSKSFEFGVPHEFFFNSKYMFHCCVVTPFSCIYSLSSPQPLILLSFSPTCPAGRVELTQRCESVPTVHALYFTVCRHRC